MNIILQILQLQFQSIYFILFVYNFISTQNTRATHVQNVCALNSFNKFSFFSPLEKIDFLLDKIISYYISNI